MALGLGLGLPWPLESGAGDLVKIGVYPPSGGPGTLYLATNSPVLEWVNDAGAWRPVIDGSYLGTAPGSVANWPTSIPGWDGHALVGADLPGVPRWSIRTGQSLAVHIAARPFANSVECVILADHDTAGGVNSGQDYGVALALAESVSHKAVALALAFTGGSPDRVAIWTAANYLTDNWGTALTPYSEIAEGVKRTQSMVLRARRTAANKVTLEVSRNGVIWEQLYVYTESVAGGLNLAGPCALAGYNGVNPVGVSVLSWRQT